MQGLEARALRFLPRGEDSQTLVRLGTQMRQADTLLGDLTAQHRAHPALMAGLAVDVLESVLVLAATLTEQTGDSAAGRGEVTPLRP